MKLLRIVVSSDTDVSETKVMNTLTGELAYTLPARAHHRFFITRHFDDGSESTVFTDRYGEGLFATNRDGSHYQITGTCQFSVDDATAADAKRWFRGKFRRELAETGAKLEFDLDY